MPKSFLSIGMSCCAALLASLLVPSTGMANTVLQVDFLETFDPGGGNWMIWDAVTATGGQIVIEGTGAYPLVNAIRLEGPSIPEPTTLALFAVGLTAVAGRRRRRV